MNNMYREWKKERGEEAWDTIHDIVEVFDDDGIDNFDKFDKIKEILERDNWI